MPNSGPFPSSRPNARTVWIGRRRYGPVLDLQRALVEARTAGKVGDTVLFLEHEPTITLGRGAHAENVLTPPPQLAALGVDLVETERGGDVTFHAPGQLVVYPIIDLAPDHCDVRRYVQSLARCMINLAAEYGVQAGTVDGLIGVWVDRESPSAWPGAAWAAHLAKVGAIGVKLTRWITMHGFAINLSTDLSLAANIVPCGIREHGVTSLLELLPANRTLPSVRRFAEEALPIVAKELRLPGAEDSAASPWYMEDLSTLDDAALLQNLTRAQVLQKPENYGHEH